MANTAYVGAGTTLGTSYYMRRFYAANADARTTTSRSNLATNSTLTAGRFACAAPCVRSLADLHMMTIMKQISKTVFQRSSAPTII